MSFSCEEGRYELKSKIRKLSGLDERAAASCKRLATSTRTCSGVSVRSPLRPSRLPGRTRLHRLTSMALSSRPRLSRSCAAGPSWPIRRRRRRRRSSRSRQSPIPRSASPHQTHRPIQLIVAFPPQEAVLPLPLHPELGGEEGHYQTVWRRSTAVNEFGMWLCLFSQARAVLCPRRLRPPHDQDRPRPTVPGGGAV